AETRVAASVASEILDDAALEAEPPCRALGSLADPLVEADPEPEGAERAERHRHAVRKRGGRSRSVVPVVHLDRGGDDHGEAPTLGEAGPERAVPHAELIDLEFLDVDAIVGR